MKHSTNYCTSKILIRNYSHMYYYKLCWHQPLYWLKDYHIISAWKNVLQSVDFWVICGISELNFFVTKFMLNLSLQCTHLHICNWIYKCDNDCASLHFHCSQYAWPALRPCIFSVTTRYDTKQFLLRCNWEWHKPTPIIRNTSVISQLH